MNDPIPPYLRNRSIHRVWPWVLGDTRSDGLEMAVVIPVLSESASLFDTLRDLAANPANMLARTQIVCVVNNRAVEIAGEADCADNQQTLTRLPEFAQAHPTLRLAWIDAATEGHELGPRDGVGLARKIGLDWALALLDESGTAQGVLISLDADTRVPRNYLEAIHAFFQAAPRWAAVVDYAHPLEGPDTEIRAILSYELFLRYQEMAWCHAGSPYAFPAIGSTMICTPTAYATSGGMNRRQAGEDFYFLQHLAKTGKVERLRSTIVVPSGRASHRVPFGTGRKVGAFALDEDDAYRTYHPDTWGVLRAWLACAEAHLDEGGAALLARATAIAPALGTYLAAQNIAEAWDKVSANNKGPGRRHRAFHQWFDAFRTLKLVHHLRDNGYPRQELFEALSVVMAWHGLAMPFNVDASLRHDIEKQRVLLSTLRTWQG